MEIPQILGNIFVFEPPPEDVEEAVEPPGRVDVEGAVEVPRQQLRHREQ